MLKERILSVDLKFTVWDLPIEQDLKLGVNHVLLSIKHREGLAIT